MFAINIFQQDRLLIQQALKGLTEEAMLQIPQGFDNNIAWNLGHILVVQQSLCYRLAGQPTATTREQARMYNTGTSPADWSSEPDFAVLHELLRETPGKLAEDYAAGRLNNFRPYTTSTGIKLSTIEDAIAFNNFHEGLHLGTILSLKNFAA